MKSSWGLDPKTLASQFGSFIEDPRTIGGGYRVTIGEDYCTYRIGKFLIEADFLDEDRCKVKIINGSSIEKILDVSYIHATEADFLKLFTETCTLANKLTNGK